MHNIHIGVGFCVAYPYAVGNAKAWKRGMSDKYSSHAFFVYVLYLLCKTAKLGNCRHNVVDMLFANTWNNILEWFSDRSERNNLVRSFNQSAKDAFVAGLAPTMLKSSISKGCSEYKHQFSAWLNTGFRIQALTGRALAKDEMMVIGQVVLHDTALVRRLIALGWDTLEIHDDTGIYGCRWKLIDHANMGGMLNESNG